MLFYSFNMCGSPHQGFMQHKFHSFVPVLSSYAARGSIARARPQPMNSGILSTQALRRAVADMVD
jgi:hypothetical protein